VTVAARALLLAALPVLVADVVTKRLAAAFLQPHVPHPVLGEVLRLTLTYNRQGVMGLPVGPYGRWLLIALTLVVLVVLFRLLRATGPGERLRAAALALVMGGACGNLLDRLLSGRGVVDFIDVGTRGWRFWTFNVADSAVDVGIALLIWALWREDVRQRRDGGAADPSR
jgi:signal peptidase II